MLVFIDESGDPGFKIDKGSSPIFVTSMVIFDTNEEAVAAQKTVERVRRECRVKPEWKFSKCRPDIKDCFFESMAEHTFRTRSVVVIKDRIYSDALRTKKDSFYKFFVRQMIQKSEAALVDAKVVIDGSGDRTFKRSFQSYLKRNLDKNCVRQVTLRDSMKDPLVQLADMTAGAIARSYRTNRSDAYRWRHMMRKNGQIENVWEFK